jgi:hypothetical protein
MLAVPREGANSFESEVDIVIALLTVHVERVFQRYEESNCMIEPKYWDRL